MSARAAAASVFAAILLVGIALRFTHLGYSEFQGDEARAMLMASRMIEDRDPSVLLWHKKGPVEILLPAVALALGRADEMAARLPFALAGVAAMVLIGVLGWRLWGPVAGVVALLIAALDGYLIAFSRIVQYQSAVLLCSVAAVALALEAGRRERLPASLLAIGAGAVAGLGTWAHYEAVFALPPVLWLLCAWAWTGGGPRTPAVAVGAATAVPGQPPAGRGIRLAALPGAALGAFVVTASLFYMPFVAHPQFAATFEYIAERRVGGGLLHDNLPDAFARASFYNPSFVVVAAAAAILAVITLRMTHAVRGTGGRVIAAVWLIGLGVMALRPDGFRVQAGSGDWPVIGLWFGWAVALLLVARRLEPEWRAVLLWFALPFGTAAFLVMKPHTHFYTMLPGAALLVGWGASVWAARLGERGAGDVPGVRASQRSLAVTAVVVVAVLALVHQWVVFVNHSPEYKRVYPEARLPGYWTPFGSELPRGGYFGFPYRAGWRAIQAWYASGEMSGSYDSNEELLITGWYAGGAARCADRPRYLIKAWRPQDAEDISDDPEGEGYHLRRVVTVGGMEKLWVYVLDEPGEVTYTAVEDVAPPAHLPPLVMQALELPLGDLDVASAAGADSLAGAPMSLEATEIAPGALPGGALTVALAWRSARESGTLGGGRNIDYSTYVHVRDASGNTVAGSDHWPGCGEATSSWLPGELHYDAHSVALGADVAPGTYGVWVGVHGPDGASVTETQLGTVTVGAAP